MGAEVAVELYQDLLIRSLVGAIEQDSNRTLGRRLLPGEPVRTRAAHLAGRVARAAGLELRRQVAYDPALRETGLDWPEHAVSMIGLARMRNLRDCIASVLDDGVPGDLIETGVWRGGSTIFMRGALASRGVTDRTVWVADSFQGLPPPEPGRYPVDAGDRHHLAQELRVGLQQVQENFRRYGLLDDQVRFLVGWFADTLPDAPIKQLAVLRLDGDMYSSTIQALDALYPRLAPGGYCIVDDYGLAGARTAVEDYRRDHGITEPVVQIDSFGAFWRRADEPHRV